VIQVVVYSLRRITLGYILESLLIQMSPIYLDNIWVLIFFEDSPVWGGNWKRGGGVSWSRHATDCQRPIYLAWNLIYFQSWPDCPRSVLSAKLYKKSDMSICLHVNYLTYNSTDYSTQLHNEQSLHTQTNNSTQLHVNYLTYQSTNYSTQLHNEQSLHTQTNNSKEKQVSETTAF